VHDLQLKDKLALVSGSTAGIGFAIANGLAHEGARVIVNGSHGRPVNTAIERIRPESRSRIAECGIEARRLPVDLSTPREWGNGGFPDG